MTEPCGPPTVVCVTLFALRRAHFLPLRVFGLAALTLILVLAATTDPKPGFSGDGPWVTVAIAVAFIGVLMSVPAREISTRRRTIGLALTTVGMWALTALQPDGAAIGLAYYIVIVGALILDRIPGLVLGVVAVGGECLVLALVSEHPGPAIISLVASVTPWYLVMRMVGQLRRGREELEALVEELRQSRAAAAESAALAERGRVARDMHDVLAHSLSALALQLEGSRLLARDRDADPEVVAAIERAHHLAGEGLAEARSAIAALRGEALPGPERLQQLASAFAGDADVVVTGPPRELGSEARLAIYRTAQEALTNVLRHSAADRVEIRLAYEADGTRLVVSDHGPGAPVAVGRGGGGYGLTGMRERAELLGGRLSAEPTADGFRVELWLPRL
jgi:signal transduction histidine kinase